MNKLSMAVDILAAASAVCSGLSALAYRRKLRRAEAKLSVAVALARKHEELIELAIRPVSLCGELAKKAGCDAEEVRCKSILNSMRYAVGMARKMKGVSNG